MYGWRPVKQVLPPYNTPVQLLLYNDKTQTHHVSAGFLEAIDTQAARFVSILIPGLGDLPVVAWADLNHPDTNIRN
jgi:hypothetical protein